MNLSMKQKQNRGQRIDWWSSRGTGVGEGRSGSLGLADANWYI